MNRVGSTQALRDQPGVLVEPGLLDQVTDPRGGQLGGQRDVLRQRLVEERGDAAVGAEHDLLEVEPHQRVRAAADQQRVVAAHDAVAVAEVAGHHRVVDEVRAAAREDGAHRLEDQVVGRALRVDPQGEVRHDLLELGRHPQDGARDAGVLRARCWCA